MSELIPRKYANFGGTRAECEEVRAAMLLEFAGAKLTIERHRRGDRFGLWIAGRCDPITEEKICDTGRAFAIHRKSLFTEENDDACFVAPAE